MMKTSSVGGREGLSVARICAMACDPCPASHHGGHLLRSACVGEAVNCARPAGCRVGLTNSLPLSAYKRADGRYGRTLHAAVAGRLGRRSVAAVRDRSVVAYGRGDPCGTVLAEARRIVRVTR